MIGIFINRHWLWVYLSYNLCRISYFYWTVIWFYWTYNLTAFDIFTFKELLKCGYFLPTLSPAVIQSEYLFAFLLILETGNSQWFVSSYVFSGLKGLNFLSFSREQLHWLEGSRYLYISLLFGFDQLSNQISDGDQMQFALRSVLWRTSVWCMGWSIGRWKSDNSWRGCQLSRWEMGVAAQGLWKDSIQQICRWSCCSTQ